MTLRGHERSLARVALLIVNDGCRTVTKVVYPDSGVRGVKPFAHPTGADLMSLEAWELKPMW